MKKADILLKKAHILLTAAAAALLPAAPVADAADIYIMNEELSGNPANGSVNHLTVNGDDVQWVYRAVRRANNGEEIPGAICHSHIYSGRMYVVSNHPISAGSYDMAGAVTVLDASTLAILGQTELVAPEGATVQGRMGLCIGDDLYISTTDGILHYILTPSGSKVTLQAKGRLPKTESSYTGPAIPYQYPNQFGSMVRYGSSIYAVHQQKGLYIHDLEDPSSTRFYTPAELLPDGFPAGTTPPAGFGTIQTAANGNLYLTTTADIDASGEPAPWIISLNPHGINDLRPAAIAIEPGIYPPANSWYAWTADGFHAAPKENILIWNGGPSTWFSNSHIFTYDIDNDTQTELLDLTGENASDANVTPWKIYGCSMRTDPEDGDLFVSLFRDYADETYIVRRIPLHVPEDFTDFQMMEAIWYPSLPVFADNAEPRASAIDPIEVDESGYAEVNLNGIVTDDDNCDGAITYKITAVNCGDTPFEATLYGQHLTIFPTDTPRRADSSATPYIELDADSSGRHLSVRIPVDTSGASLQSIGETSPLSVISLHDKTLTVNASEGSTLYLLNMAGQSVLTRTVAPGHNEYDLGSVAPGIYIAAMGRDVVKVALH